VFALAACAPSSADAPITEQWRNVEVTATLVEASEERLGQLRYRGGVALTSELETFGGLSGLEALDDNRLLAISDAGDWIEARLLLDESGTLIGVADVRMAFMRDERGEPFAEKEKGDSEGLTQLPDGRFAVSFEQSQTIRIYDLNRDGPFGAAAAGPRLQGVRRLPDNVGLEALAVTSEGALLVGAEGGGRRATPLWIAPLAAQAPVRSRVGYRPESGYSLTSFDRLPDGGFVALERFYAPLIGARARITRFSEESLRGRTVEAEELTRLAPPFPVDNFEGVAAARMPDGATRLYIVSDDNFSDRQRTMVLAFDIVAS
jgi:hypothetical protein